MLLDTHVHLIDRSRLRYPWLANQPQLDRDWSYTQYLAQARQLGIDRSMHMEVDVAEEDMENESDWIGELLGQPESQLVGAIAACRPEHQGFAAFLERQQARPWVRGFRRVLHVVPDELSTSILFRENVARLANSGHVFDICARADQLSAMAELVDTCPRVQFILDHCGVPNVADGALDPWRDHVGALAQRDNVAAKISGVIAYGNGTSWQLEDIRPFVEHVVESFGWDRVVWGSDSPVCTLGGALSSWVAATHALFATVSYTEREKLYYKNAERLWQIGGDAKPG